MLATHINKSDMGIHTDIKIIDSTIDYNSLEELNLLLLDFAPDIVGLRCLYVHTDQFHQASSMAKQLPKKPLVIGGGPYPSSIPYKILAKDEHLDIVVVGEGEEILYDLVSAYYYKNAFIDVPGIFYRQNDEIKQSGTRDVMVDLDSISFPDWTLIDFDRYKDEMGQAPVLRKLAPILTTRGCPYACTYCHELFQKRFRTRSAKHIVEELEILHDLGVQDISVIDDIFNLYPERVIEIFNLIIQKNLKLRFYYPNGLRGDRMTHEAIDAMVDGGSILFTYALESGSKRIQKLCKKQLNFERFYDAVDYTIKKGVMVDMFLMVGFPTETVEEALKTLDFLMQWDEISFPYLNTLNIFPGTEMYDNIAIEGVSSEEIMELNLKDGYHRRGESYILSIKAEFLRRYFLRRDRLEKAIAIQRRFLREDEILRKYKTYLPINLNMDKFQTLDEFVEKTALDTKKTDRVWTPD
tara:strand:- start:318 stop:1718 length:1401 start_codon:yes stop_codon:yes gene_type:complete